MTASTGRLGEDAAAEYLLSRGYRILRRNYRSRRAEIDIVARKEGVLVFVEVKARRGSSFGEPEEAVTREKLRRIRSAASAFLSREAGGERACRFDVVAVLFGRGGPVIRHTEDVYG